MTSISEKNIKRPPINGIVIFRRDLDLEVYYKSSDDKIHKIDYDDGVYKIQKVDGFLGFRNWNVQLYPSGEKIDVLRITSQEFFFKIIEEKVIIQQVGGGRRNNNSSGSQGPQGYQGYQGTQGVSGAQGPQGFQGEQGFQGAQGFQGFQGNQGNQGVQGFQGNQGFQGDAGSQGPQGFQGNQGFQGAQGVQGSQGAQGVQGNQGAQGPVGPVPTLSQVLSAGNDGGGQAITNTIWNGSVIGLAYGGTNANLTASNGGIFYSTATAGEILSGTATAGQMLRSGANAAPTWSTATFPSTATGTGTILRADGTNWVASTNTYPNTTPVNQILFATSANVIGGSTTALISGTTLVIGATTAVSGEQFSFQGSTNAAVFIRVKNATSGTAAQTGITITDAANLSIGFTSYSALFASSGISEAATGALLSNQTNGLNIGTTSNTQTSFWTNNTKRATFLSTGELTVGGTTTVNVLYKVHTMGSAGIFGNMISSWSTTDTHYGVLGFLKSASATIGTGAATAASEDLGQIQWNGYNSGNAQATPASIRVIQSGAAGATFIGADMIFLTGTNAAVRTQSLKITAAKSVVIGDNTSALSTTATDGFLYIPTCAGTPTGVPTAQTGTVAMVFDTTNNKLYIYDGGWLGGTTPGAFT